MVDSMQKILIKLSELERQVAFLATEIDKISSVLRDKGAL